MWITSGTDAGLFVVWARTSDAPGASGVSAFLVRGDAPGLSRGKPEEKLGQHGSTTTTLDFSDVEVSADALLGEEGRGFRIAMMALDGGRIGIGSLALGVASAATDFAIAYAKDRKQFGRAIAEFQAIQWMIADNVSDLDAARLLVHRAAWRKEQGLVFSREAAMAKLFASERGFACCNRALQILGGYGYSREYPVERHLRDIRVTSIYEGTSEIQRIVISRDIAQRFSST
jgi:alkylation response protein AidB-like acyl-CoA dehydrogenase